MELVFKALGDPNRRHLLDQLFERDGQTLSQLEQHLSMTRFGVMKHLKVLEDAGLVTTRKVGREKFHFLNPVPIRLVHDRWISKYAAPWAAALTELKTTLEATLTTPRHVFQIHIRATPEELWRAITDSGFTTRYYYGAAVESDWEKGSTLRYLIDGQLTIEGEVLEIDPPRRLVTTFAARWDETVAADPPSRVTWEIEDQGGVCKLTVVHDGFDTETPTYGQVGGGWPEILSGLKTLLETGAPLRAEPTTALGGNHGH